MFDPNLHYALYRDELARREQELERRRMLPKRERYWLPRLRSYVATQRRSPPAAARGC